MFCFVSYSVSCVWAKLLYPISSRNERRYFINEGYSLGCALIYQEPSLKSFSQSLKHTVWYSLPFKSCSHILTNVVLPVHHLLLMASTNPSSYRFTIPVRTSAYFCLPSLQLVNGLSGIISISVCLILIMYF